jgi:hypothetical protein
MSKCPHCKDRLLVPSSLGGLLDRACPTCNGGRIWFCGCVINGIPIGHSTGTYCGTCNQYAPGCTPTLEISKSDITKEMDEVLLIVQKMIADPIMFTGGCCWLREQVRDIRNKYANSIK